MTVAKLPIDSAINGAVRWIDLYFSGAFALFIRMIGVLNASLGFVLQALPPWLLIALLAALAYRRTKRQNPVIVAAAMLVVWNLGLWRQAMDTISLVLLSTGLSAALGIPFGIVSAESWRVRAVVTPVLDFMQTTPAFVYLIPSVIFFNLGVAPGVFATCMFALPPILRATQLGLMEVKPATNEAALAFGSSPFQLLTKIKIPLAVSYIFLGLSQGIMMSLNVVVIAALIGAPGLGMDVVASLSQLNLEAGIEAGVAIVLVAIVLEAVTAAPSAPRHARSR